MANAKYKINDIITLLGKQGKIVAFRAGRYQIKTKDGEIHLTEGELDTYQRSGFLNLGSLQTR